MKHRRRLVRLRLLRLKRRFDRPRRPATMVTGVIEDRGRARLASFDSKLPAGRAARKPPARSRAMHSGTHHNPHRPQNQEIKKKISGFRLTAPRPPAIIESDRTGDLPNEPHARAWKSRPPDEHPRAGVGLIWSRPAASRSCGRPPAQPGGLATRTHHIAEHSRVDTQGSIIQTACMESRPKRRSAR